MSVLTSTRASDRLLERPFDGRFFQSHSLFWALVPSASRFSSESDWPPVETYARAFSDTSPPPVRFEPAPPPRGRRRTPVDPGRLYDARITHDRCVPTRPRSWHDFLNALVWATFPRAKAALHARQHRALVAWAQSGRETMIVEKLPNARTRELDALALVDEGGVLDLVDGSAPIIFGHALYEGLVLGTRAMIARTVVLPGSVKHADELLAARLGKPLAPEHLPRTAVPLHFFEHLGRGSNTLPAGR